MTRRKLFYSLVGGASGYSFLVEPRWLKLTHVAVRLPHITAPIRLLHISDLHASSLVPLSLIEHAVNVAFTTKPDVICITGDFITDRDDFDRPRYVRILQRLSAAAPTFAVLGNHDGGPWAKAHGGYSDTRYVQRLIDESSIELLQNRVRVLQIGGQGLSLAGVGDMWAGDLDADRALSNPDPRNPVVLLSHNPDSKSLLARHAWDLMLSGHTHGGQVIMPVVGPAFAPVEDKRYVAGLKPWGSRQIYVTRGVGSVGSVRFACRPEVNLLTITA